MELAHSRDLEQYAPEDASLDHDTKMEIMWRSLVEREPEIKAKIQMLKKDFYMAQNTYLENVGLMNEHYFTTEAFEVVLFCRICWTKRFKCL